VNDAQLESVIGTQTRHVKLLGMGTIIANWEMVTAALLGSNAGNIRSILTTIYDQDLLAKAALKSLWWTLVNAAQLESVIHILGTQQRYVKLSMMGITAY